MTASTSSRHAATTAAAARVSPYLLFGILAAAALVRLPFLPMESSDFTRFLKPWYDVIDQQGASSFARNFSDYTPPYLYFLAGATQLPVPALAAIKAFSLVFDVVLAFATLAVVRNCGSGPRAQIAAFALVLFAPTVVLNGAAWAQCDALYVSLLISAMALLQSKHPAWAMLLVGVALAFKVQTVFLFPLFGILLLRGELPWRTWFLVPLPYLAASVPAWLMGRGMWDLLTIYRGQAEQYTALTYDAPSIYAIINVAESARSMATLVALVVIALATLAAWRLGPKTADPRGMLTLATFFAVLVPFVLPHMHDRYFYLADALTIAYAIMNPRRWYLPVLVVTSSFGAYLTFLWKFEPVPLAGLALLMAAALVVIARDTFAGRDRVETPAEIEPRTRPSFSRLADSQVVRFSVIGGVCTIAYLALYVALREVMAPLVANALALSLTAAFNFAANRRWTFAMIEKPLAWQALEYSGAYLIGLAASTVALAVAMDVAGPSPRYLETALALAASVFATLTRFVLMRWVVFAERPLRRARTASRGSAAVPAPTLPRSRPT